MNLPNCTIGYIKACNNDNIGMKSVYLYFYWFSFIFLAFFLLIFMNTQIQLYPKNVPTF